MNEFSLSRQFARDFADWEESASERDVEEVDRAISQIVTNPRLRGRFPSFYDLVNPSFLYRCGSVLIHYRVAADGAVEFLNLYHR